MTGYTYLLIDCEDGSSYMLDMMRVAGCGGGSGDSGGTSGGGGGDGGGYTGGGDGGGYTGGGSGSGGYYSGGTSSGGTGYVGDPIGILVPAVYEEEIILPERPKNIEAQLTYLLEVDPFALLEIPCDQLPKWQTLAQHKASQSIKDKINQLDVTNTGWFDNWAIQTLNGANGTIVNMDYFSVSVSNLPSNPTTGLQFTPESFLDYFRRNINSFVDGSTFSPYCETPSLCTQETALWNSANPTGTLVYIDILGDDGVVVCSEYTSSYWYFMTLEAPGLTVMGAGNHPVSGTRQFGFEPNGTGGYNFFVRGVDRFDSNIAENTLYMTSLVIDPLNPNPFFGADNLWRSFQEKLNQFINNNSGSAIINEPVKYRPDWDEVKQVLEGSKPISSLGCK